MRKIFVITIILVSLLTLFSSPLRVAAQKAEETLEVNKEIVLRYMEEVWNKGDMAVADEVIAENFVNHNPFGKLPPDRESLKMVAAGSAAAPGHFTTDEMIAEGDKVAIRTPYHGDPAFDTILILRVQDGKITDRWAYGNHARQFAEANKKIARRFLEDIWNKGDMAAVDELVAEDFVDHSPPGGREELKQHVAGLLAAFSAPFSIDDMVAEGDKVVMRGTFKGIQKGEFMGIAPTGKEYTHSWTVILRMQNGKIVERWADVDRLKFMNDLGLILMSGEQEK